MMAFSTKKNGNSNRQSRNGDDKHSNHHVKHCLRYGLSHVWLDNVGFWEDDKLGDAFGVCTGRGDDDKVGSGLGVGIGAFRLGNA